MATAARTMMTNARDSEAGDDFGTPPEVCDMLYDFYDGIPDLDPCTGPTAVLRAVRMWSVGGLQMPWFTVPADKASPDDEVNTVFVNNPYSRMAIWGAKVWREVLRKSRKQELIWLPPASTSSGWWANFVAQADAVAFTRRLNFIGQNYDPNGERRTSNARFHSALVYYGPRVGRFRKVFAPITTFFADGRKQR